MRDCLRRTTTTNGTPQNKAKMCTVFNLLERFPRPRKRFETSQPVPGFTPALESRGSRALREYECLPGYSVDGKPSGARTFLEKCGEDTHFEQTSELKDIDWCIKYAMACGDGNECVDKLQSYACVCKEGL